MSDVIINLENNENNEFVDHSLVSNIEYFCKQILNMLKYICESIGYCVFQPIYSCIDCCTIIFNGNELCAMLLLLFCIIALPLIIWGSTIKHTSPTFSPTSMNYTFAPSMNNHTFIRRM